MEYCRAFPFNHQIARELDCSEADVFHGMVNLHGVLVLKITPKNERRVWEVRLCGDDLDMLK